MGLNRKSKAMRWCVLIFILLGICPVVAQQDMTFEKALLTMLENSKLIKSEQYNVDVAYNEMRAAKGLRWPKIDIVGSVALMQKDVDIDFGGTKGVVTQTVNQLISEGVKSGLLSSDVASLINTGFEPLRSLDWRYTLQKRFVGVVGASLTVPIYMGGRINIANRAARITLDVATYSLDATESRLLTELVERYFGVIVARHLCEVRTEARDAISKHLSDVMEMEKEGVVAHSAVVFMQYKLAEAERDLSDANNKLHVAELALNSEVGLDEGINPIDRIFLCNNIYSVDYYSDMASSLNPILCEARLGRQLSEEGVRLARAALLPEVVAMGAGNIYNYQLNSSIPRWSIGVGIRIPLFDGLGKEYRYKAAKGELRSVEEYVENAQSEIMLLVEKEYYTFENTLANITATKQAIALAETYYYSANEGFVEGVVAASELMDACVEVAAAKVEYLNAVYENCLALARLLEASGLSGTFLKYMSNSLKIDI